MASSFFLDKSDPGSWRALNGFALKVSAAAEAAGELAGARRVLTDAQFSALQWCAITMNAFNRVSVLSGHPVRPPRTGAGTSSDLTKPAPQTASGVLS